MKRAGRAHWTGNPYRRPNSPYWYIVFADADGVTRRRSTKTTDLRIARRTLEQTLHEVEQAKLGLVDRFARTRTLPIQQLVDDYQAMLEAKQSAPRYVTGTIRQIDEFLSFAKVRHVPQIHIADAERFLNSIRATRSAKTRDHYAGALRGFSRWLERTGLWECDVLRNLTVRTANRDKFRVFRRVSFRFAEAERLVEAAWARHLAERCLRGTPAHHDYGEAVRDRQVLYWFVLTTAFRAKECASLRWEDLSSGRRATVGSSRRQVHEERRRRGHPPAAVRRHRPPRDARPPGGAPGAARRRAGAGSRSGVPRRELEARPARAQGRGVRGPGHAARHRAEADRLPLPPQELRADPDRAEGPREGDPAGAAALRHPADDGPLR